MAINDVSQPAPKDQPDAEQAEDSLKLADSNAGSTTEIVQDASRESAGATPSPAQSAGESVGAGASTGGFETMLGKVVVSRGLATPEEVELCNALRSESEGSDDPRTLGDLLVDNSFLTRRQLERVRTDFEAKKSSQRIPGFRIIRKLGAGAMATVFLAKQLSLDRHVAIKVLPKRFSANEKFIARFIKEGRAAAQLNHPNIVQAYDVGHAGQHHYFVMEYVDGRTVYALIVKSKRIGEADAIQQVLGVAHALQHAHERGFIHRDIKPKNIMINNQGVVKLADLGLARAVTDKEAAEAEAGRAYGTPYYISPEQIRGAKVIGPGADIYGLGATFYHMVTGRVPYEGKNPSEVMHKHLKTPLKPPDHVNPAVSAHVAEVIEMMMAKTVESRYQRASDLIEDLELLAEGQPPHFAHRELSLAEMSSAGSVLMDMPDQPPIVRAGGASAVNSPAFMIMLILNVIFLIVIIIMGIMLSGK